MRFPLPQPLRPLLLLTCLLLSVSSHLFAQAPTWQDATSPGAGRGNRSVVDAAGNTYVTGSFTGTATFGATTLASAGGDDVFVAKRTPAGAWLWATRAGGSTDDSAVGVAVDGSGNVVVTGWFESPTVAFGATTLTKAGGYADLFVVKLTPTGAWQWAIGAGGSEDDNGIGVAVDGSGNVYVTGWSDSPTITFGATTLTPAGGQDVFVAKLAPTGAWLWATRAGGSGREFGYGVAVDGSGSAVVSGRFSSPTIAFGTTTLTNANATAGSRDLFVAKLSPAGAWLWATGAGGSDYDEAIGVALDGSGNVYVTGWSDSPTIAFGTTTLTNATAGSQDFFVAKLAPTGAWLWATGAGGNGDEVGVDVAVDGSGSVVVSGLFSSPTLLGATTLTSAGASDVFVAKLTASGTYQWAVRGGGSGADFGYGVALDGSGGVVVSGSFQSPTISFGATTLTNPSVLNEPAIFLARLSGVTGRPEVPDQPALTVVPNPGRTTVQLSGAAGATATLLDARGRLVLTAPLTPAGGATLDVRALPAGLYVLRAGGATRRLVVE